MSHDQCSVSVELAVRVLYVRTCHWGFQQYLLEVDPHGLLVPNPRELHWFHCAALLLNEVGILCMEYPHNVVEHVLVGVNCLTVVHVVLLTMRGLVPSNEPVLLSEAVVCAIAPAPAAATPSATVNPPPPARILCKQSLFSELSWKKNAGVTNGRMFCCCVKLHKMKIVGWRYSLLGDLLSNVVLCKISLSDSDMFSLKGRPFKTTGMWDLRLTTKMLQAILVFISSSGLIWVPKKTTSSL